MVVGVEDSPKPPPRRITLTLPAVRPRQVWLVVSARPRPTRWPRPSGAPIPTTGRPRGDRNRADGAACRLRRREQADTDRHGREVPVPQPAERLRTLAQAALNADDGPSTRWITSSTIWSTIWSA